MEAASTILHSILLLGFALFSAQFKSLLANIEHVHEVCWVYSCCTEYLVETRLLAQVAAAQVLAAVKHVQSKHATAMEMLHHHGLWVGSLYQLWPCG